MSIVCWANRRGHNELAAGTKRLAPRSFQLHPVGLPLRRRYSVHSLLSECDLQSLPNAGKKNSCFARRERWRGRTTPIPSCKKQQGICHGEYAKTAVLGPTMVQ